MTSRLLLVSAFDLSPIAATREEVMRTCSPLLPVFLLVAIAVGGSGCTATKFPENPPPHELLQALEVWPDDYYWLVETGVSSRVLGLRQPGDSMDEALARVERMLEAVKDQWQTISRLDAAQAIMEHLKAHDLEAVAGAIQQTLDANQAEEPGGSTRTFLQSHAIKRGLIGAYRKIKERRG
jgi:hypothetical protein